MVGGWATAGDPQWSVKKQDGHSWHGPVGRAAWGLLDGGAEGVVEGWAEGMVMDWAEGGLG